MTTETSIAIAIGYVYPTISTLAYYFIVSDRPEDEKNAGLYLGLIIVSIFPIINAISVFMRIWKSSFQYNVESNPHECMYETWSLFDSKYWKDINSANPRHWGYHYMDKVPLFLHSGGIDVKILAFPLSVVFFTISYLIYHVFSGEV